MAPTNKSPQHDSKPYDRPADDTTAASSWSGTKTKKTPGRTWTADELEKLFVVALGAGPKQTDFEGAFPDRTSLQAMRTWQNTVVPYIKKQLREKGDNARR